MKAKNSLRGLLCPKFWGNNYGLPLKITFLLLAVSLIANLLIAQEMPQQNAPAQYQRATAAQPRPKLSGKVMSAADFKPLAGATIRIGNNSNNYRTDQNGYFNLTATAAKGMITISFIGYEPLQISYSLGNYGPFEIVLQPLTNTL
jgi:hypothetical protein